MHFLHVVGARPNFVKAAPVWRALQGISGVRQTLVHTGQHYDPEMSEIFLRQLGMPEPKVNLAVGSGTHAQQTADVLSRFEPVVLEHKPDRVIVYGDVNSTLAAALVCAKLCIPVAHVEAGLRSQDFSMPEEVNRILTDRLCDLLFTPSQDADDNLQREGLPAARVHRVGNVMIDTLVRLLPQAAAPVQFRGLDRYVLVTLHRPGNVDDTRWLRNVLDSLGEISESAAVLFPVHPRTSQRMKEANAVPANRPALRLIPPLSYLEFLALERDAQAVVTDSGGVQEETSYLGVPCLTMRENTERPITLTSGTNLLIGRDIRRLQLELRRILNESRRTETSIPLWDGHAAARIRDVLISSAEN